MSELALVPANPRIPSARRIEDALHFYAKLRETSVLLLALGERAAAGRVPVTEQERAEIQRRLDMLEQMLNGDDGLADLYADRLLRIRTGCAELIAPGTAAATLPALADRLVTAVGKITVPPRVNEILSGMRAGGTLDFHEQFKVEVPSADGRVEILADMNSHPANVQGIVDVTAGTIRCVSPRWWRRALSWLLIAVAMAVAFTAAATTNAWLDELGVGKLPTGVPDHRYVLAVAAAYGGALLHLLVTAVKQRQRSAEAPERTFVALGNLSLWVHVHETYLLFYALAIPVAAYTLILMSGAVTLATVFFVGYAIDSVLDVIFSRFDTYARQQSEMVVAALGAYPGK